MAVPRCRNIPHLSPAPLSRLGAATPAPSVRGAILRGTGGYFVHGSHDQRCAHGFLHGPASSLCICGLHGYRLFIPGRERRSRRRCSPSTWIDPAGKTFSTVSTAPASASGSACFSVPLKISTIDAGRRDGTWTAAFSWNGYSMGSLTFAINPAAGPNPTAPSVFMDALSTIGTSVCSPGSGVASFMTTDASASFYFGLNNLHTGDAIRADWVAPDNSIPTTRTFTQSSNANTCFWTELKISGNKAATLPGIWSVRLTWNNIVLLQLPFQMVDPAASSPSTLGAAEVGADHLPSYACHAPVPASSFRSTDPAVYLYYIVYSIHNGDETRIDWVAPDGTVPASHASNQAGVTPVSANRCYWESMQIFGGRAESLPGDWLAKIYWNRDLLASVPFHISNGDRPAITSVVNGFSYRPGSVAPRSAILISGSGFGAGQLQASGLPVPTSLGPITVQLDGTPLRVQYADPNSIYALLPLAYSKDQGTLTVTVDGIPSPGYPLNVTPFAPDLLRYYDDGTPSPGPARVYRTNADGYIGGEIDAANPAKRGDVLVVLLTGLGPVKNPPADGDIPDTVTLASTAMPGSVSVSVLQTKGGTTVESTAVRIQVADLPATGQPVGTITGTFLRASAHGSTELQGSLAFKDAATSGAHTTPRLRSALKAHSLALQKLADTIDSVAKGTMQSADLGTLNGQKITLTQANLAQADRYIAAVYQNILPASPAQTSGNATGLPRAEAAQFKKWTCSSLPLSFVGGRP